MPFTVYTYGFGVVCSQFRQRVPFVVRFATYFSNKTKCCHFHEGLSRLMALTRLNKPFRSDRCNGFTYANVVVIWPV